MLAGAAGWAQQSQKPVHTDTVSTDLAITFAGERSQASLAQGNFWLKGGGADAAMTFWKGLGIAASLTGGHAKNVEPAVDVNKISYLLGPRYTRTVWTGNANSADPLRLQVFAQGLYGGAHGFHGLYPASGGGTTPKANSQAFQAGGGLNLYLNRNFGLRLIEADYVRTALPNGADNVQNDLRLSAGITWHIASAAPAPPPVSVACSASPVSIFPGDPVTVTATASGLNPKLNAVYTWSGSGVSGNGTTATVATVALAPGSYTVKCGVKEGKAGQEGLKPWEAAEASTSFTVKAFEPPTISCSANPGTIKPGETSAITAAGVSPQNRPLTYSYAATAGTVAGNGSSATFSSAGAPNGSVGISCNVSDDKGQTATANTSVTILAPYVAPAEPPEVKQLETRLALHSVFFPTNLPTAKNPKGGLVASQQGTLTALASDFKNYLVYKPEAQLTLTGHADLRGSVAFNQALSERRVARTKQFLVEQGVPEAKIETRGLGSQENLTAAQVKALVEQNPNLSPAELGKVLKDLGVIVWAQNRRVDVTLSTTGQQSVRLYPFNVDDAETLIGKKTAAPVKKAAGGAVNKPVTPVKKKPVSPKK
jgi:outer membrane protein OmpA-like peptidoglycan-associated protein